MRKIVEVTHTTYGKTELNVDKVIAVCPKTCRILFDNVYWTLSKADFDKVYKVWKGGSKYFFS
jgi:hypothetical protein